MQFKQMFVTAVCVLFLLKLKWPKSKNFYETPNQPNSNSKMVLKDCHIFHSDILAGNCGLLFKKFPSSEIFRSLEPKLHSRVRHGACSYL